VSGYAISGDSARWLIGSGLLWLVEMLRRKAAQKKTSADAEDDRRWPVLDIGGEINFPAKRSPQNNRMLR